MKHSIVSAMTALTMTAMLTGCNGTSSTSPSTGSVNTGFSITGSGQNAVAKSDFKKIIDLIMPSAVALSPAPLVDKNLTSVSLNEAWIVIKEIEFEANEQEDSNEVDGEGIEYQGPYFVDLLSNAPTNFGDIHIAESGVRRVKMKLHKSNSLPTGAPNGLSNNSIFISGTINGVAFTYSSDDTTKFTIAGPNPIIPKASMDMLAVIRMADLFKKIDLSAISSPTDISASNRVNASNPCPQIQPSASDLYTCFRKGLESETDFGNDNGDDDLDGSDESVN